MSGLGAIGGGSPAIALGMNVVGYDLSYPQCALRLPSGDMEMARWKISWSSPIMLRCMLHIKDVTHHFINAILSKDEALLLC